MMGKHDPLLKGTFSINGKSHSVWLFEHQLTWCPQKLGGEDMSDWMRVKLTDVFSAEYEDALTTHTSHCCLSVIPTSEPPSTPYLMVYYAQRRKNSNIWECEAVKLGHPDLGILSDWSLKIQSIVNGFKHRLKNFLILLNPFGGKRRASIIFESSVKPILELAGARWTLVKTQHQNHATETLMSMSQDRLLEYDTVVAIGGDGTACEVVTGLLRRSAETSASNQDTILQPAAINIGVIPAGSSNALAYSVHGTDDPCTAAIHLVLGGTVPLDVGAIHDNQSGGARFFVTQVSYGHLADTLEKSDKLRWMGPRRYDYAGLCKFMNHAAYEGTLEMRLAADDSRKPPSECGGSNCLDCASKETLATKEPFQSEWKRVEGRFLGVSAANISCRCTLCPRGLAPFAHLSDGHLDVILVRVASRANHLRYLMRTAGDSRRAFQLPFIERYHVKELVFTPVTCCSMSATVGNCGMVESSNSVSGCGCDVRQKKKKHSVWNCDGELLRQPNVRVTVHKDLIRIVGRASQTPWSCPIPSTTTDISPPPNVEPLTTEIPI